MPVFSFLRLNVRAFNNSALFINAELKLVFKTYAVHTML